MKAKFNGVEIEGTPEEMAQLVKLVSEMPRTYRSDRWIEPLWPTSPSLVGAPVKCDSPNTSTVNNPQMWTWTLDGANDGGVMTCANFPLDTAQQATSTAKAVPQTLTIQA